MCVHYDLKKRGMKDKTCGKSNCVPIAKTPQGLTISNNIVLSVWQDFDRVLKNKFTHM